MVVLHNQIRFDQNALGAESIVKESKIIVEPLNLFTNVRTVQYKLTRTEVTLQDEYINLGLLTELQDDTLFSLDRVASVAPRYYWR